MSEFGASNSLNVDVFRQFSPMKVGLFSNMISFYQLLHAQIAQIYLDTYIV